MIAAAAVAALVAALVTSPFALRLLRGRVMDIPNHRSSHDDPTPRGGGVVIIVGVGVGWIVADIDPSGTTVGVAVAALALAVLGAGEDLIGIQVVPRLAAQVVAGGVALLWLMDGFEGSAWWIVAFATASVVWIVGYTNAFNFMDGINGIAAAQLIVAGLAWYVIGGIEDLETVEALGLITAGAALGYLPWNFPRARFFMGDVGSYLPGGLIASVSILLLRSGVSPVAVFAPLVLFGLDTSVTLARRLRRGEPVLTAHSSHIYQRTVQAGWSHTSVTTVYLILSLIIAVSGLAMADEVIALRLGGGVLAVGAVAWYLALPRLAGTD